KLVTGIVDLLSDDPEGLMKAHLIGHLLGYDFSGSPHVDGIRDDAQQIRGRALQYLGDLFRAATQDGCVLIYLEDLHWADTASLDLLDQLMATWHSLQLFLLSLSRPLL